MPATLVSFETARCDQIGPSVQADLPALPGRRGRHEERRRVRRRIANLLRRRPKTAASYYDPLFIGPENVEDDYYRFRHQPSG